MSQEDSYRQDPSRRASRPHLVVKALPALTKGDVLVICARAPNWCENYHQQVQDPPSHLSRVDEAFSRPLDVSVMTNEPEDTVIQRTCQLLSRLPASPPELDDGDTQSRCSALPDGFFSQGANQTTSNSHSPCKIWRDLRVVAFVSTNIVRLALKIVTTPGKTFEDPTSP
jgi:hypothetical protein